MITFNPECKKDFDQLCSSGSFLKCYDFLKEKEIDLECYEVSRGHAFFRNDSRCMFEILPEFHRDKLTCYIVRETATQTLIFDGTVDGIFVEINLPNKG